MVDLESLLEESGAILNGHFLLTSGRHSATYFEKFRVLERPDIVSAVCAQIAAKFRDSGAQVVAGPTTGGIIIAFEVGKQLGIPAVYIEREAGQRVLRRGASIEHGAKVLVVDDVLTTGGSIFEVIALLRKQGAQIVGVSVLVDRSEAPLDFGAPFEAALKVEAQSFAPDEVPEWLAQIPLTSRGSNLL
jgi:orotate phosphoribosyltransferase